MTTLHTPVGNGGKRRRAARRPLALPDTPELAQFKWRTTVSWIDGTHS